MGRIQTDTGLITGIPITDTIDKLMALEAKPRDRLSSQNDTLKQEQAAVTELTALLLSIQYVAKNLGKDDLYTQRVATSSDANALAATVTGTPTLGTSQFIPLRMVQSQQLLSSGIKSSTDPLGVGTMTFRFGADVQRAAELSWFGGGAGVVRGKIRITDRSGATADVDLSAVQTVDDVLEAINGNGLVNVTAVAEGDHLRLIDNTGQSAANLRVQEVGAGKTAASLGLAGINVAADSAAGQDMLGLYADLDVAALNDGAGVGRSTVLPDIRYTLRDGTTGEIDLSPLSGSTAQRETTLGEILDAINAKDPLKLKVEIAPDGKRLIATDLTAGGGTFQLTAINDSQALRDLGLDGAAAGGTITGRRLLAGAKTVLLSSLNGGQGLGQLGLLDLTDRSGAGATVDLTTAETLDGVIQAINAAGIGITARVNQAGNGVELDDTTGETSGTLVVANGDLTTNTAGKLGIAVNDAVASVNSGDLHLQVIARDTSLADLNGGRGVARGSFTITDTTGARATLNLNSTSIQTVGDVIDAINRLPLRVHAELNATGDGILLADLEHGSGTLAVAESGSTTAADLHLLHTAATADRGGTPTQVIDGTITETVTLGATDTLEDLQQKINDLGAGLTATILNDGSSRPYRLLLASDRPGAAGRLVCDTSQLGLSLQETVRAQDALLAYGNSSNPAANVLASSSTNHFDGVLPGVGLEIKSATGKPVAVTVGTTNTDLTASAKTLVDNYNKFRKRLGELTAYNTDTQKGSLLTGDSAALRLDMDLSRFLSQRFWGAGTIQSLAQVGIGLEDDGTLALDQAKFQAKYAADPNAVQQFFAADDTGVSARFDQLLQQIAGEGTSLLASRLKTIQDKITENQDRIDAMNARLDNERVRLYTQFYLMEVAISKLRSNASVLDSFVPLEPLTTTIASTNRNN